MRKANHLSKWVQTVKRVLVNVLIYLLALVPSIIFAQSCLASSSGSASVSDFKNVSRVEHYKYNKSKILEVSMALLHESNFYTIANNLI